MPLLSVNLLLLLVVFAEIVSLFLYKSLPPSTKLYRSLVDTPNQHQTTCSHSQDQIFGTRIFILL